MTEYEFLKDFNPIDFYRAVIQDRPKEWRCSEFDEDMEWLLRNRGFRRVIAFKGPIDNSSAFYTYLHNHANFRRDLIKYGFIAAQKREEVFYKCGDKLKDNEGNQYRIIELDNHTALLLPISGQKWRNWQAFNKTEVKDTDRITQEEFEEITKSSFRGIIKISD